MTGLHPRRLAGAAALMMGAVLASRLIGFLLYSYVAWAFGAGRQTDAFYMAFTIPDWLNYLVAGGTLSITFITIFSPFVAQKREAEGYRVFASVATFLGLLIVIGGGLAEVFTPWILHWFAAGFTPEEMAVCVHMTRILLPAQLFFCVGGLCSAILYTRGSFWIPALAPLFYNSSIILGGVLLGHWLGISSLAVGAVAGAVIGPFFLPLLGATRSGLPLRLSWDFSHPEFRRWIRLTLPLMIGVSLATADNWIMQHLGAGEPGAISQLNYAKRLIGVPIAVLGQAVGQATMPFFSSLITQKRWDEFRDTLDRSIFRTASGALIISSLLAALALPAVRLVYQRGHFSGEAARLTAAYFFLFTLSLIFWSAQGLYSRAFYAAGDTLTPMLAGTIITAAMYPLYVLLYHRLGVVGLALASDLGIAVLTVTLALLLHRRGWLGMKARRWRRMPLLLLTVLTAGAAGWEAAPRLEPAIYHFRHELLPAVGGTITWTAVMAALTYLFHLQEFLAPLTRAAARLSRRPQSVAP